MSSYSLVVREEEDGTRRPDNNDDEGDLKKVVTMLPRLLVSTNPNIKSPSFVVVPSSSSPWYLPTSPFCPVVVVGWSRPSCSWNSPGGSGIQNIRIVCKVPFRFRTWSFFENITGDLNNWNTVFSQSPPTNLSVYNHQNTCITQIEWDRVRTNLRIF